MKRKIRIIIGLFTVLAANCLAQEVLYPAPTEELHYGSKEILYRGEKVRVFENSPETDETNLVPTGNLPNGKYVAFFKGDTSKLAYEVNYLNNQKNGVSKEFYLNGNLRLVSNYKNGKLNGSYLSYYRSDGKLKSSSNYKEGKLNGASITYFPSGKKKNETEYKDDMVKRCIREWNEQGELIAETYYKNGRMTGFKDFTKDKSN